MNRHTIVLCVSAACPIDARGWAEAVLGHWPSATPPNVEVFSPEALEERLGAADAGGSAAAVPGPVLVVLGPEEKLVAAYTLADHLRHALTPAAVLFREVGPRQRKLQRSGILVEPWSVDPRFLACALYALAERQGAVDGLARDLRIAQSSHGGVRGEMDKIHEELNLAAMVQREFLPKRLPDVSGLEFGVLFRPATYVSGDIYDVVKLDEHRVGFFIADAVGHGVPAALLTMVISRSLRMTESSPQGPRLVAPAEAMGRLNAELIRSQRESPRFVTAVYGLIDTQTRRVTLAGAGHPPPLKIGRGGAVERIETDGPLLGVFQDEVFHQVSFQLGDDETLLLYSDGFETAFPGESAGGGNEQVGRPTLRYVEHFARLAGVDGSGALDEAMTELAAALDRQSGSLHQIDDVTALAIASRPQRAVVPAAEPELVREPLRRAA
jgi:phosphoserine phosphatase RsbU/P